MHVDDLIQFIQLAIYKQKKPYELYNVGYGSSVSIKNLVKKVIACSGKTLKINYDLSKPSNKTKVSLDCTKAKTELGWEPKISLEKGISTTMEWYKKNILIN